MTHAGDRRLFGFLVLSALLHLAWLAVPLSVRTPPSNLTAPLVAHLAPRHEPATEIVTALPGQNSALARRHLAPDPLHSLALPAHESVVTAPDPAPTPPPTINLDSARATARAYAREAQARNTLDAPKPQLTVEAAIARATEPDSVVEMRGPAGDHITQTRDLHCVTPLVVPHYMTGMTVPSQCTKRKT
jgi:hypothetical protein